ncbi:hypothetical protein [Xanthomonas campestris]|uniref:hypothetical protein n=1 Tax=Xanthomonas campestris TaxID=339 RepID=UPI0038909BC6
MNVKEAVDLAKSYIADLFGPEGAQNIGLEEVEPDLDNGRWLVTIGFSRPWDQSNALFASIGSAPRRTYKLVTISSGEKQVVSVKNRETKA